MTPEFWTIIGVGIALASLILAGQRSLRREIADVRSEIAEVRIEFAQFRSEVASEIAEVRKELGQLRERMAHLEGLLEGLREAIAHNRAA